MVVAAGVVISCRSTTNTTANNTATPTTSTATTVTTTTTATNNTGRRADLVSYRVRGTGEHVP